MPLTVRSGVITLLHTACGAGILAMPFAFKPFGLVLGLTMITWCGLCAFAGLLLQCRVSRYAPEKGVSFFVLSSLINRNLSVVFDCAIAVKCFGVGVSYMIVVGDLLPQIWSVWTSNKLLLNRDFHITMVMIFIVAPLCFMKKLNSLRYASMIAISAVAYLCVLVIYHFIFQDPNDTHFQDLKGRISIGLPRDEPPILTTLPIFVFAYTCHHNMFSVINEQVDQKFNVITKIAKYSMSLAFLLYIVIGYSGYLTFGDKIVGNIVTLYPNNASSTIGRIAIAILVTLTFPLQCHPARASIHHIIHFFQARSAENGNGSAMVLNQMEGVSPELETTPLTDAANCAEVDTAIEEGSPEELQVMPLEGKRFIFITCTILFCSYLLAVSVTSLAKVLAIVGATGSTSISFILPGIFGYKLIGSECETGAELPFQTKMFKYLGLCLAVWGLVVMVASLTATFFFNAGH
ncbi:amino acid transporter KNAG_0B02190 [Huiozyma naganishii CBS 8797]|uniref:Amino acid transporter transmembrane domain-containing protein n=1 Tax=Huiozyma naganishii (strain ATCC MYA-139 / BCRC 22969 / CBS 8797 / KCTC 17520 / NBRC 10181 / NCYC 3082 / Yp74L-3) TaxID=1071383 RepID=J7S4M1_HUIN7|nr:hypothetical protein KNAG_0B02190 [Kazachstania naganishii CBS 8797]CCK68661.1 hypothetical protein KNAG_0B02190 [Kazachstania naganishii CBS 8797]